MEETYPAGVYLSKMVDGRARDTILLGSHPHLPIHALRGYASEVKGFAYSYPSGFCSVVPCLRILLRSTSFAALWRRSNQKDRATSMCGLALSNWSPCGSVFHEVRRTTYSPSASDEEDYKKMTQMISTTLSPCPSTYLHPLNRNCSTSSLYPANCLGTRLREQQGMGKLPCAISSRFNCTKLFLHRQLHSLWIF